MIILSHVIGLLGWLSAIRFGYGLADIEISMKSTVFYGILSLVLHGVMSFLLVT